MFGVILGAGIDHQRFVRGRVLSHHSFDVSEPRLEQGSPGGVIVLFQQSRSFDRTVGLWRRGKLGVGGARR